MAEIRWKPNVTVAAYIEHEGKLLWVREHTSRDGIRINNAAGHLEAEETPLQAVCREVLEETGHPFRPEAILGFYLSDIRRQASGEVVRFLRIAFVGTVGPRERSELDAPIIETVLLSADEIRACAHELRSPLMLRGLDDYEAGRRYPLDLIWCAE